MCAFAGSMSSCARHALVILIVIVSHCLITDSLSTRDLQPCVIRRWCGVCRQDTLASTYAYLEGLLRFRQGTEQAAPRLSYHHHCHPLQSIIATEPIRIALGFWSDAPPRTHLLLRWCPILSASCWTDKVNPPSPPLDGSKEAFTKPGLSCSSHSVFSAAIS